MLTRAINPHSQISIRYAIFSCPRSRSLSNAWRQRRRQPIQLLYFEAATHKSSLAHSRLAAKLLPRQCSAAAAATTIVLPMCNARSIRRRVKYSARYAMRLEINRAASARIAAASTRNSALFRSTASSCRGDRALLTFSAIHRRFSHARTIV